MGFPGSYYLFKYGVCRVAFDTTPHSGTGSGRDRDVTAQLRESTGRTAIDCDIIYGSFVVWSQIGVLCGVVLGR